MVRAFTQGTGMSAKVLGPSSPERSGTFIIFSKHQVIGSVLSSPISSPLPEADPLHFLFNSQAIKWTEKWGTSALLRARTQSPFPAGVASTLLIHTPSSLCSSSWLERALYNHLWPACYSTLLERRKHRFTDPASAGETRTWASCNLGKWPNHWSKMGERECFFSAMLFCLNLCIYLYKRYVGAYLMGWSNALLSMLSKGLHNCAPRVES